MRSLHSRIWSLNVFDVDTAKYWVSTSTSTGAADLMTEVDDQRRDFEARRHCSWLLVH